MAVHRLGTFAKMSHIQTHSILPSSGQRSLLTTNGIVQLVCLAQESATVAHVRYSHSNDIAAGLYQVSGYGVQAVIGVSACLTHLFAIEISDVGIVHLTQVQLYVLTSHLLRNLYGLAEPHHTIQTGQSLAFPSTGQGHGGPILVINLGLEPGTSRCQTDVTGVVGIIPLLLDTGHFICQFGTFLLHPCHLFLESHHSAQSFRTDPSLCRCAAPVGVYHANGYLQLVPQLTGKEIADSTEFGNRFRRAFLPSVHVIFQIETVAFLQIQHILYLKETDFWIICICNFLFIVEHLSPSSKRHFHVTLSAAQPDFSHQHVLQHGVLAIRKE